MTDRIVHRRVWGALTLLAAFLMATATASAETCAQTVSGPTTLIDSLGFVWDNDAGGAIDDGGAVDAFDTYGTLSVSDGVSPPVAYVPPDPNGCTREDGGREIVFPEQANSGLQVSRKLYVPASGRAFGRWLNILRNAGPTPINATVTLAAGIGADAETNVVASSSGDTVMAVNDAWVVTDDAKTSPRQATAGDPALIHVWQATQPGVEAVDAMPFAFGFGTCAGGPPCPDDFELQFQNVTVPPGGTVILMNLAAQRTTTAQANDGTAEQFARGSLDVFAGVSDAEKAAIRNWVAAGPFDADLDRAGDATDNCPHTPNQDQLNTDLDAFGNVCDPDDDNDNLSDADEAIKGTNPLKADTDGDGRRDRVDVCPRQRGLLPNGCVDRVAPRTTVTTKSRITIREYRSGVRARVRCDEGCSMRFELLGSLRGKRLTALGDVLLANRVFTRRSKVRDVVILRRAGLVDTANRFTVRLRVTTIDATGNRRVTTKRIVVG